MGFNSGLKGLTAAGLYAVLVGSKQIGVEVNANKTKYMVMSGEQNAGRSHSIKTDNNAIQREKDFKDLGKNLKKNQNSIQVEITRRLKSRNTCYHSVQNLLSSSLLSKN
jgi:predicted RNA-binding protein YlxR (DUF448 family)